MSSIPKMKGKPIGAAQPTAAQTGITQTKSAQLSAPPVYRPNNAVPRVGAAQLSPRPQSSAPPVYRPALKSPAQLKIKLGPPIYLIGPPVYRPQNNSAALRSTSVISRAPAAYRPSNSVANAAVGMKGARMAQVNLSNTHVGRVAVPQTYPRPFAGPFAILPLGNRTAVQRMEDDGYASIKGAVDKLLPYGAGNRKSDLTRTRNESQFRVKASANLGRKNRSNVDAAIEEAHVPGELASFMKAALNGYIVGAGNCLEQGVIGFFLAIERFKGCEIYLMAAKGLDHQFALVVPPGTSDLEEATVVDAWQPRENGKKLKKSSWAGSDKIAAKWSSSGETFLKDAVGFLEKLGIDEKARDQSIAAAANTFRSSGDFFSVYDF